MITLGMTNSVFSIVIGLLSRHVPREAIVGVGSILHVGLMVFLLVWIPATNLKVVYYVISALWGFCDAIWQTQCNCECWCDVVVLDTKIVMTVSVVMVVCLMAVV